jgi:uncharacterized protein (TIGR02145 family)
MKNIYIIPSFVLIMFLFNSCKKGDENKIKDGDGNGYNSITIGSQIWLTENLKTTTYNDGSAIPLVTDSIAWMNLSTPAYCWYRNDESYFNFGYGALYNWYVINTGKLCPAGWYIPMDADWTTLVSYLEGDPYAAEKLKESGSLHWNIGMMGGSNTSGFTALPAGIRDGISQFNGVGAAAFWWTATVDADGTLWDRGIGSFDTKVRQYNPKKTIGISVRCLKDK